MKSGRLVFARQIHGCEIAVLSRDNEKSEETAARRTFSADAMVTDIFGRKSSHSSGRLPGGADV